MRANLKTVSFLLAAIIVLEPAAGATGPVPPKPRSRSEIEAVLAKAPKPPEDQELRSLNIVLVADEMDHASHEHGYPIWQKRWQLLLGGKKSGSKQTQVNLYGLAPDLDREEIMAGAPNVSITTAWQWPSKQQFKSADLIVMFCYGKWNKQKLSQLKEYLSRGGGFVSVHPCCIAPEGKNLEDDVAELIGLVWKYGHTTYRHGPMDLKITARRHPICLGLPETIYFLDEAYWPLIGDLSKVTVLANSNEKTIKDPNETRPEPMFWTYRYGQGRVYGCILGHYNWTFDDPYFRILLLRGMAWAAGQSPYRFDSLVLRGAPLRD